MEDKAQVLVTQRNAEEFKNQRTLTMVIYGLYALSLFTGGLPAIVAIIINYLKRAEMRGTWLESHFEWQIKTFWWMLLGGVVAVLLMLIGIGFILVFVVGIWYIYRLVKGFLRLLDNQAIV